MGKQVLLEGERDSKIYEGWEEEQNMVSGIVKHKGVSRTIRYGWWVTDPSLCKIYKLKPFSDKILKSSRNLGWNLIKNSEALAVQTDRHLVNYNKIPNNLLVSC